MKNKIFIPLLSFFFLGVQAQTKQESYSNSTNYEELKKWNTGLENKAKGRKTGWNYKGLNSLQMNQSTFKDWIPGGSSSISFLGKIDYEANFTKGLNIWDSELILSYGFQNEKDKADKAKKIEDTIKFISSYGRKFTRDWYYGGRAEFKTQFSEGFDYEKKPPLKTSNYFAPAYLSTSIGFEHRPHENLSVSVHPLGIRMTFIKDQSIFNTPEGTKKPMYGLDPGNSFLAQLGGAILGRYKFDIIKNIFFDHHLNVFFNYFDMVKKSTHRDKATVVINYGSSLIMKVNEFLSSQFTFDLAHDKKQTENLQIKQTLGIGLIYMLKGKEQKIEG